MRRSDFSTLVDSITALYKSAWFGVVKWRGEVCEEVLCRMEWCGVETEVCCREQYNTTTSDSRAASGLGHKPSVMRGSGILRKKSLRREVTRLTSCHLSLSTHRPFSSYRRRVEKWWIGGLDEGWIGGKV